MIDWDRVSELRDQIGADDFGEVVAKQRGALLAPRPGRAARVRDGAVDRVAAPREVALVVMEPAKPEPFVRTRPVGSVHAPMPTVVRIDKFV